MVNSRTRRIEEISGYRIAQHLGATFGYRHTGNHHDSADCEILDSHIVVGLLEISQDNDEKIEALADRVLEDGERIPLHRGMGVWITELSADTRFDILSVEKFLKLIQLMTINSVISVNLRYQFSLPEIVHEMHQLGLISIRKTELVGDFVYCHLPITGGLIDDSKELLADFGEAYINEETRRAKLLRLKGRANTLKKHFCIVLGSATSISVQFRLDGNSLVPAIPKRTIQLPDALDSLWILSLNTGNLLGFDPALGWEFSTPESGSDPWWKNIPIQGLGGSDL